MTDRSLIAVQAAADSETRPARAASYAMLAGASVLWGCWTLFFRSAEHLQAVSPAMESFVVFAVTLIVLGPGAWQDGRGRNRSVRMWTLLVALGVADALRHLQSSLWAAC